MCLCRFLICFYLIINKIIVYSSIELFRLGSVQFNLPILLDYTSIVFLITVSVIAGSVIVFSLDYMAQEKFFLRFHLLVALFVGSIFLLILSPNLVSILLGWDGLGVTSFLLVIYFNRSKSFNAGVLTALRNRVGDCLILLAIGFRLYAGSWEIFIYTFSNSYLITFTICILLVIARTTKSAQIPFSAWLPAAMAAPTPVSSLVHSSTLVTAGIYLLIRFNEQFVQCGILYYILIIGVCTILLAGLSALFERDIKKIVALSTLSQLGLIIRALGIGFWKLAFFHLVTHAFFKALLFISVGNMIHLRSDYQDLRIISLNTNKLSFTLVFSLVANFRLIGFPFLSGFYSKDLILESCLNLNLRPIIWLIIFISTALTAAYTIRFLLSICWAVSNLGRHVWFRDSRKLIKNSIIGLWVLTILGGRSLTWLGVIPSVPLILNSSRKFLTPLVIVLGICLGAWWSQVWNFQVQKKLRWSWGIIWALPLISTKPLVSFRSDLRVKSRYLIDLKWNTQIFTSFSALSYSSQVFYSLGTWINAFIFYSLLVGIIVIFLLYLCILKNPKESNSFMPDTDTQKKE